MTKGYFLKIYPIRVTIDETHIRSDDIGTMWATVIEPSGTCVRKPGQLGE